MPETLNPALLALRPRPVVLLCNQKMTHKTLNSDQKSLLLHSVARFLDRNGFSKTLKKFRSESQIQVPFFPISVWLPRKPRNLQIPTSFSTFFLVGFWLIWNIYIFAYILIFDADSCFEGLVGGFGRTLHQVYRNVVNKIRFLWVLMASVLCLGNSWRHFHDF